MSEPNRESINTSEMPLESKELEEYGDGQAYEDDGPIGLQEKWEERQRELVTSVLNYNLSSLIALIGSGKVDMSPSYQRRSRWDSRRQSRLIESFLMNVPVPPVFLNEDDYGKYSVIDGKQRLTAINDFLNDRYALRDLKIFTEINGKQFSDLPREIQSVLETRATIQAIIILRQSSPDIKFEVFERLNTGGLKLNAQEIRNSTWPGPFNDLILRLSESTSFHDLLRISDKRKSAIWKSMRDVEFVLRYFAFRNNWRTFKGGMKRPMDQSMVDNQHANDETIESFEQEFQQTVSAVHAAFGEHAFKRWDPIKKAWRSQILASVFDAQMFALRGKEPSEVALRSKELTVGMQSLFSDEEFRKSIDAATNTPALFRARIEAVNNLVDRT